VAELKSLGYCRKEALYLLPNKAPKGPFTRAPGIDTPPMDVGIEIMAIEFLFND
jgi:hypothetical protein